MKYIIVAYDKNRIIGGNNQLLWQNEMPSDIHRFRKLTSGNVVIMGRKTYESIGRPLANRQNIVITRQKLEIEGAQVVDSLEKAYEISEPNKDIYVIGGGQIFEQSLDSVDRILATEIDSTFDGDVYFPKLSSDWYEESCQTFAANIQDKYDYSFVTYTKQK